MKLGLVSRTSLALTLLACTTSVAPTSVAAQDPDESLREAFFRAVADHFEVPLREVTIIGEWELDPDEVPVVLFLARRAGVSPDALIGLRRNGRSWMEVSSRFGLGARAFHVPLPQGGSLGPLARADEAFRSRPAVQWGRILLEDREIVAYVNVRVLSGQAGVPPLRVLEKWQEAGSFLAAYPLLRGG